jgi:microcin C transport system substrate-binding protein
LVDRANNLILPAFTILVCLWALLTVLSGCSSGTEQTAAEGEAAPCEEAPAYPRETLPAGIEWLTNDSDPVFASPAAVKGGTFHQALLTFPLTFRVVGPDSNSSFRSAILGNQLGLIGIHPNTENIIPELATHWAYGADKKTMYFKLDPEARWSDGHPVTADDFVYTLEFMRSKHIVAPWYNDYYTKEIERVIVYDAHTFAIVGTKAQPDLHLKITIGPTPRHFYCELDENFVRRYNWKVAPNTGPYQMTKFRKGRYILFERKKDWWARERRYFKHRFNVDRVRYTVIRDFNLQWEYFKKGQLDSFSLTMPKFWHYKSITPVVEKGYVQRIWFFNDTPQSAQGLWLNLERDIFQGSAIAACLCPRHEHRACDRQGAFQRLLCVWRAPTWATGSIPTTPSGPDASIWRKGRQDHAGGRLASRGRRYLDASGTAFFRGSRLQQ